MPLFSITKGSIHTCCCCCVASVVSDPVRPHRRQCTRLPHPWDSPGKNTGVGCHFLLQCMKVKRESEVAQSCPTLSDPMDCSLPGSSTHGIFQARALEWGAIAFSGFSQLVIYILEILLYCQDTILSWHHSIPFHVYTTIYLNDSLLIDIWIVSNVSLLQTMLQWITLHIVQLARVQLYLQDKFLGVVPLGQRAYACVILIDIAKLPSVGIKSV